MSLDINELKRLHDKAYTHNQVTRERASDDLVFYHVTQWDDSLLENSQLGYRGEFNVLRKAGRQILADLRSNPVQVDFDPVDVEKTDGADLLDGLYRSSDRYNTSIEAYDYSSQDAVVCGFGAWELYTEYKDKAVDNTDQIISRRYIPEANNTAFCDPNAKRLDKSDANYWSILTTYSEDGYKALVEELTGEENASISSFKYPEQSYVFPWFGQNSQVYIASFYHREKIRDKILTLSDPFGSEIQVQESKLSEVMDDLIDQGYEITDEKAIERWEITRYIASGSEILKEETIAGENLPVVPVYGERAFVEGEETYEGITRLAKDPQRLRNFQMSYLADIASRSPRPKPIFFPEQIQRYEDMYAETGPDNNYPYYLQNRTDAAGAALPLGPVAVMPEQSIPTAVAALIDLSRGAIEDVANPGIPQDIADPDVSGKAVIAMQNRMDQQSYIYQHNLKFAKRRDGEIYASMAAEVYGAPRNVTITLPSGETKKMKVQDNVIDKETGELVIVNDLTNSEFDVFADITPSYASQKESTIEQLGDMVTSLPPGDPMRMTLMLKQLVLMDGVNFDDIRDYAKKQLLITGIREPETPEEEQMLAEMSAQSEEPSADMVFALAEKMKAETAQMKEQRESVKTQADIVDDQLGTEIDAFKAETDRMNLQVDAQVAGATIEVKRIEAFGKQLDNISKVYEGRSLRTSVS